MNPGKVIVGLALAALVAMLGDWGWEQWRLTRPGFHETDCWFSKLVTGDVTCGYMVVPENRQAAESRTIRLPVVIFDAVQEKRWHYEPPAEPILFLTGGPGGQAHIGEQEDIDNWWYARHVFPKGHNLIVMGQRGTGLKEPDFDCEEFETPEIKLEAHPRGTPPPDVRALEIEAAQACIARLQAEGVDLTAYNSRESAADIAELRLALGIEEWNLYGVSYGTRLALSVLRYHPEGVRSVILDSVYPPEASSLKEGVDYFRKALYRFLDGCGEAADCAPPSDGSPAATGGGAWADYLRLRKRLAEAPVEIALDVLDPQDGRPGNELVVTIDDRFLDWLLFQALYARETRPLIQLAVEDLAGRGGARLPGVPTEQLLGEILAFQSSGSDAVFLSHLCRDEMSFESAAEIAEATRAAGSFSHLITDDSATYLCAFWPSGAAAEEENTPVASEVPVLLLAGGLDPVTPPALARAVAPHLPNGHLFEFPDAGHGILYEVDCVDELLAEFIADPRRRPASGCRL